MRGNKPGSKETTAGFVCIKKMRCIFEAEYKTGKRSYEFNYRSGKYAGKTGTFRWR